MTTDGRILFVDDDKEDRFLIAHAFSELGMSGNVDFLNDGVEVLPFLEAKPANPVRLIILDLNMPVLNGTETLRVLKNDPRFCNIPVLILTTSANRLEKENSLQLGAVAFREKPARFRDYLSFCEEMQQMAAAGN